MSAASGRDATPYAMSVALAHPSRTSFQRQKFNIFKLIIGELVTFVLLNCIYLPNIIHATV